LQTGHIGRSATPVEIGITCSLNSTILPLKMRGFAERLVNFCLPVRGKLKAIACRHIGAVELFLSPSCRRHIRRSTTTRFNIPVTKSFRQERSSDFAIGLPSRAYSSEEMPMENPTKEQIIHRAYQLWEQAGKPEGRDQEFYHQAEKELKRAQAAPAETPEGV
jgi:hypothetical protein